MRRTQNAARWIVALVATATLLGGCHSAKNTHYPAASTNMSQMPRELRKTVMPPYRIEPPDELVITAVTVTPKSPYTLRPSDLLSISVPEKNVLPGNSIDGLFMVEPGGLVNLGPAYGTVTVTGITIDQAKVEIEKKLAEQLVNPGASVSLAQIAGQQQIAGPHLVGPDGNVNLGTYGLVSVVGLTVPEVKQKIEQHLSRYLESPEISVDVAGYNSKVYYVITEGAGLGDQIQRLPITGNETVLDAISNIQGLQSISSQRIWIARPTPNCNDPQILDVDWRSITVRGSTATNYQILPGDRVFIAEDGLVGWDNRMAKFLAPIERIMGFATLGVGTVGRFSGNVLQNAQQGGGFGGF